MWSIAADALPGGDPPRAYADLGRWLTRVVSSRKTGPRGIEAAGREIGRELAPMAGHASPETTKRIYAHYEVSHLREAFDRFSATPEELAAEASRRRPRSE